MSIKPGHIKGRKLPTMPPSLVRPGTIMMGRDRNGERIPFVCIEFVIEYPETEPVMRHTQEGSWFTHQRSWVAADWYERNYEPELEEARPAREFLAWSKYKLDNHLDLHPHVITIAEALGGRDERAKLAAMLARVEDDTRLFAAEESEEWPAN